MPETTTPPIETYLVPPPRQQRLSNAATWRLYLGTLLLSDLLLTGLALWLAYLLRFEAGLPFFQENVFISRPYYTNLALVLVPTWLLIYAALGLYKRENLLGGTREYDRVLRGATFGLLAVLVFSFLDPTFLLARGWLLLAWLLTFLLVAAGRFSLRRLVYWRRRKGFFLSPAVLVGGNEEARLLAEQLWSWRTSGLHIAGAVCDQQPPGTQLYRHVRVLGSLADLETIVQKAGAEELIIASSALRREQMLAVFERFGTDAGVNLRLSSGLFEIITTGLEVKEVGYVALIRVNRLRLAGIDSLMKAVMDYGLALPALLLLSPVLLLLALAVRLDSPGPVIHRRRVMGVNGTQFDAFKFRSMHINGDQILAQHPDKQAELSEQYKLKDDPRVTRLGRLLRKTSLDELPQLLNVLRGEMSLVGPRIISPPEMAEYAQWGLNLLTVKPGITGLWQISGRSDVSYAERVRLDMHYIRNWTIWLDLQILIQTLPTVLKRRGAY
ncbi:MAG: sugar transferase [Anaerolineales bacterium]|nr:sugar transferase [Anaerolineales bacterium]